MEKLMIGVNQFFADEEGVTMVEYGLIAALISIVALIALTGTGTSVKAAFTAVCNALSGAAPGSGAVCS